jgi:hypothetical protein
VFNPNRMLTPFTINHHHHYRSGQKHPILKPALRTNINVLHHPPPYF